jgi:hypothetical protein
MTSKLRHNWLCPPPGYLVLADQPFIGAGSHLHGEFLPNIIRPALSQEYTRAGRGSTGRRPRAKIQFR